MTHSYLDPQMWECVCVYLRIRYLPEQLWRGEETNHIQLRLCNSYPLLNTPLAYTPTMCLLLLNDNYLICLCYQKKKKMHTYFCNQPSDSVNIDVKGNLSTSILNNAQNAFSSQTLPAITSKYCKRKSVLVIIGGQMLTICIKTVLTIM